MQRTLFISFLEQIPSLRGHIELLLSLIKRYCESTIHLIKCLEMSIHLCVKCLISFLEQIPFMSGYIFVDLIQVPQIMKLNWKLLLLANIFIVDYLYIVGICVCLLWKWKQQEAILHLTKFDFCWTSEFFFFLSLFYYSNLPFIPQ